LGLVFSNNKIVSSLPVWSLLGADLLGRTKKWITLKNWAKMQGR